MDRTLEEKIVESLRQLPEQYQLEALDFIEFLKTRHQIMKPLPARVPAAARTHIARKMEELWARGGPKIEEVIKKLGGLWPPPPEWNSTEFIRQDRESH